MQYGFVPWEIFLGDDLINAINCWIAAYRNDIAKAETLPVFVFVLTRSLDAAVCVLECCYAQRCTLLSFLPPSYLQPEAQKHGTIFIGTPFLVSGVGLKTLSWEAIWVRDMSLIG